MSVIDKANEYIGHPFKMDESYTTSVRRDAYARGYEDMIDKACEWLKEHGDDYGVPESESGRVYVDDLVCDFRKAMEE